MKDFDNIDRIFFILLALASRQQQGAGEMKIYEKTDPELSESPRIRIAKYVAAHKEVSTILS